MAPGAWERKRLARRAEILEVAQRLLIADGLEAMSMHKLARALGCSPGALYRCFVSRDEIVMALQIRNLDWLREVFAKGCAHALERSAWVEPGDRALAAILAYCAMYSALPGAHFERFRLITLVLGDAKVHVEDEAVEPAVASALGLLGDVSQHITHAQEAGALGEGLSLRRAVALWTSLHGVTVVSKMGRFPSTSPLFAGLVEETAQDLLVAWGASRPRLVEHRSALGEPEALLIAAGAPPRAP